jgi:hypothetical protein
MQSMRVLFQEKKNRDRRNVETFCATNIYAGKKADMKANLRCRRIELSRVLSK